MEYLRRTILKKNIKMLVSTEWLNSNLSEVKIFDASWHMPNSNRNAHKEYLDKHIPGSNVLGS